MHQRLEALSGCKQATAIRRQSPLDSPCKRSIIRGLTHAVCVRDESTETSMVQCYADQRMSKPTGLFITTTGKPAEL